LLQIKITRQLGRLITLLKRAQQPSYFIPLRDPCCRYLRVIAKAELIDEQHAYISDVTVIKQIKTTQANSDEKLLPRCMSTRQFEIQA